MHRLNKRVWINFKTSLTVHTVCSENSSNLNCYIFITLMASLQFLHFVLPCDKMRMKVKLQPSFHLPKCDQRKVKDFIRITAYHTSFLRNQIAKTENISNQIMKIEIPLHRLLRLFILFFHLGKHHPFSIEVQKCYFSNVTKN